MTAPTLPPASASHPDLDRPDWLHADDWPYPVHGLPWQDRTIAYTDVGDGPTLLMVHTGMWSFVWRDLISRLSDRFRCVTFDAPGNGLTTGGSDVDLGSAAGAVTAVVEALDLTDVILVIHDLGGVATLQAAAAWPDRVAGIAAVNTFAWQPSGAAFRGMLAVMGSAPVREIDVLTGFLPRLTSTSSGVGRHFDRHDRRVFRRGMDHRGRRSFHRYLRAARYHDYTLVEQAVARFRHLPALTVFGERNDPLGFQPQWAERFDHLTQLEISKGNHFPMCDDPDLVAEAIADRFTHQRFDP